MNEVTLPSGAALPRAQDLLAVELQTYERELARLLAEGAHGRWVLIHGRDVIAVVATFEDAIQVGFDRFGLTPFLVQQVLAEQPVSQQPWQRSQCRS
jgi:hypothetical protein